MSSSSKIFLGLAVAVSSGIIIFVNAKQWVIIVRELGINRKTN